MTTVLSNAQVLDVENGQLTEGGWIVFADGIVKDRGTGPVPQALPEETRTIDVGGATVLPGLIDAHVHLTVTTLELSDVRSWTEGYAAARTHGQAARMLRRGFTTVRDVGGADHGLARAAEEGLFPSPRIFFGGKMISQTGGHGDHRALSAGRDCRCEEIGISTIADGPEEVRRAVRAELRKGASHIKLAASGGVASPHDEIDAVQFTHEEIRAAVVEADNANRYVTVHAYHPRAIRQALQAGVRCVEHGNLLDRETIDMMAGSGAYLVPTLVTYELLHSHGVAAGLPEQSVSKVAEVRERGLQAYAMAHSHGVPIAFGTDLLAEMEFAQLDELTIRSRVTSPLQVLKEATCQAAALLRQEGRLGTLLVGAAADALVVRGNPLDDISVLTKPETHLEHVIQRGEVVMSNVT